MKKRIFVLICPEFSIIMGQKEMESRNKGMGDVNYQNASKTFSTESDQFMNTEEFGGKTGIFLESNTLRSSAI